MECPFLIPFILGAKGIGCASTSWAAVGAGKLVDEVEACLDIFNMEFKEPSIYGGIRQGKGPNCREYRLSMVTV